MARFQLKRIGCETQPITPRPKSTILAHRKSGIRLQDSETTVKKAGPISVHFWDPKMVPQSFLNTTLLLPANGEYPTKAGSVLAPKNKTFATTLRLYGWLGLGRGIQRGGFPLSRITLASPMRCDLSVALARRTGEDQGQGMDFVRF